MTTFEAVKTLTEAQKQKAAAFLRANPVAQMVGMELVDISPGEAVISFEMRDQLRQPHGILHGGITATLIDTAMAFAVVTELAEGEKASTIDLTIHYLRPHTEGMVTCTAKVVRAGKRIFTLSAEAVNGQGKLIATAISTYTKV
ncbi:MAG TPA: PaaI family thioesterase [Pyrinomonadaceae bacterium]|jgi:acyl-CoA thioesterase|nr:PaaI family thioesterase [Pyrinomonadaceae bacterium]